MSVSSKEPNLNDIPVAIKQLYLEKILPIQNKIEAIRMGHFNTYKKIKRLTMLFSFFLVFAIIYFNFGKIKSSFENDFSETLKSAFIMIMIAFLAPTTIIIFIRDYYDKCYKQLFKDLIPLILNHIGNFSINNNGINLEDFANAKMLPSYSIVTLDDQFIGSYKNISITLTEGMLGQERMTKNDKGQETKYTVTVFQGLFIAFSFNKNFVGHTVISSIGNTEDLQYVELEDPEFASRFQVKSSDQVEARYLITTGFMDKLIKINNKFKHISCGFFQDKLYVMISSYKDFFKLGDLDKYAITSVPIIEFINDIHSILEIVDILKLDSTTKL